MADKSGIGTVITIAAVGGIGWWLWNSGLLNSLFGTTTTAAPTPTPTPAPAPSGSSSVSSPAGSGAGSNIVPPAPTPAASACTAAGAASAAVRAAMAANAVPAGQAQLTLTMDQWNWYLPTGCVGPDPGGIFPGDPNRGGMITAQQYLSYIDQGGFGMTLGLSGPRVRRVFHPRPMMGTNLVRRSA